MVGLPFWREFRTWVRSINPEAYLVGEVWWQDYANERMYNASPWLAGDAFDAVMNYRFARECGYFFKAKERKITASEFLRRLDSLRAEYRPEVNYVLMNLLSSHDTDRLGSQIVNADARYDGAETSVANNKDYLVRKPNAEELQTQKLMVMFQMTYFGAPMVYYGDEAGMWGADDPDDRKPMLWADMTYENESHHPFGVPRPNDPNVFNADLFAHYATCIKIRRESDALKLGDLTNILADDARDIIAYCRSYGDDRVLIVLNNSRSSQRVRVPLTDELAALAWKNVFDSTSFRSENKSLDMTLKGKSGVIVQAKVKR
jgi:glycosidase